MSLPLLALTPEVLQERQNQTTRLVNMINQNKSTFTTVYLLFLFTHIKDAIIIQKGFDDSRASPQQLICTCQRSLIMWYVSLLRRLHSPVSETKRESGE